MNEESSGARLAQFVSGSGLILLGNAIGLGSKFATRLVAARLLSPSSYGTLVVGIAVVEVLVMLSLLGVPQGLARQIPRTGERRRLYVGAVVVCGLVGSLATVSLAGPGGPLLVGAVEAANDAVLLPLLFAVPFLVVLKVSVGYVQGLERARLRIVVENLCNQLGRFIALVAGLVLVGGAVGAAMGWGLAVIVSALGVAGYLLVGGGGQGDSTDDERDDTSNVSLYGLILFSLPLMVSQSLWRTMQHVDTLLLGAFYQADVVGVYDGAFTVSKVILLIPISFTFLFLPYCSKLHKAGALEELRSFYSSVTKWMVWAVLPGFLVFVTVPGAVLKLLFGPAYAAGAASMVVLSVGFFLHALLGLSGLVVTAFGETRRVMIGNAGAFVVNLSLNVALIPQFGMLGAATASTAAYLLINAYFLRRIYQVADIVPFRRRVLAPLVFTFATVPAGLVLRSRLPETTTRLAAVVLVTIVVVATATAAFDLVREEDRVVFARVRDQL